MRAPDATLRSTRANRPFLMKKLTTFKNQRGQFGAVAAPIIGGIFSAVSARRRNRMAIEEARKMRAFQERMSSTAHQREVRDLRAAGLNPILSATGGSGASSPSGAQAPIQDVLTPAINTALAARRAFQEIKNMRAQEILTTRQGQAIAPVSEMGEQIGSWISNIKNADWGSMMDRMLQDIKSILPSTAKQLTSKKQSPLEITIPGYKRDLDKHRKRKPKRNK